MPSVSSIGFPGYRSRNLLNYPLSLILEVAKLNLVPTEIDGYDSTSGLIRCFHGSSPINIASYLRNDSVLLDKNRVGLHGGTADGINVDDCPAISLITIFLLLRRNGTVIIAATPLAYLGRMISIPRQWQRD